MTDLTAEELKKIAIDLHHGDIFTDRHVNNPSDIPMVFFVLSMASSEIIEKLQADPPGLIFEYLCKAMPRSINGMPMFASCRMLSKPDTERVFQMLKKLTEAEQAALR